jgi:hypothetical protein
MKIVVRPLVRSILYFRGRLGWLVENNNCHSSEPGQSIVEHRARGGGYRLSRLDNDNDVNALPGRRLLLHDRERVGERKSDMIRDQELRLKRTNLDNK